MAAKNAPQNVAAETVTLLAKSASDFRALGVTYFAPNAVHPYTYLERDTFMEAVNSMRPVLTVRSMGPSLSGNGHWFYSCKFTVDGLEINGTIQETDLPSIGYHLVDGKPVPIDRTA